MKMVQVGDRFNQCEAIFGRTYRSFEQGRKALCRCGGCFEVIKQPIKGVVVVFNQLAHAGGQPCEREFVAWQDKVILRGDGLELFAGLKPALHGVGIGFSGVNADV